MSGAEMAIVWDAHLGGQPVCLIGIESQNITREGYRPLDGPIDVAPQEFGPTPRREGFTLVEIMVAMLLSLILGVAIVTVFVNNSHSFTQDDNVLFLLGAALVIVGRPFDAFVSLLVIGTNIVVGIYQEVRAKQALDEIAAFGVTSLPGLVVDGEVKASGRIPTGDQIAGWLAAKK